MSEICCYIDAITFVKPQIGERFSIALSSCKVFSLLSCRLHGTTVHRINGQTAFIPISTRLWCRSVFLCNRRRVIYPKIRIPNKRIQLLCSTASMITLARKAQVVDDRNNSRSRLNQKEHEYSSTTVKSWKANKVRESNRSFAKIKFLIKFWPVMYRRPKILSKLSCSDNLTFKKFSSETFHEKSELLLVKKQEISPSSLHQQKLSIIPDSRTIKLNR